MILKLSEQGRKFIYREEGVVDHIYQDQSGYFTIGVGHFLTKGELFSGKIYLNERTIDFRNKNLSHEEIDAIFNNDIVRFEAAVSVLNMNSQHRFDAFVSLAFNIGDVAFSRSTLKKLYIAGRPDSEIVFQMKRWNKSAGIVLDDLIKRRNREVKLYLCGDYGK